jgi:hypothetical protein
LINAKPTGHPINRNQTPKHIKVTLGSFSQLVGWEVVFVDTAKIKKNKNNAIDVDNRIANIPPSCIYNIPILNNGV